MYYTVQYILHGHKPQHNMVHIHHIQYDWWTYRSRDKTLEHQIHQSSLLLLPCAIIQQSPWKKAPANPKTLKKPMWNIWLAWRRNCAEASRCCFIHYRFAPRTSEPDGKSGDTLARGLDARVVSGMLLYSICSGFSCSGPNRSLEHKQMLTFWTHSKIYLTKGLIIHLKIPNWSQWWNRALTPCV